MIKIRPSTDADVAAVTAIYAHHVLHGTGTFETTPPDPTEIASRRADVLAKGLPYLVIEDESDVLGFAYCNWFKPRPAYRFSAEDSIYMAPDVHRKGMGRALLAELCSKALEARVRLEAKSNTEKYIEPPFTTVFAILFLPTEGLYAEVLRRPGLMESLQRDHRITLAGPTTLLAMLSSLQMGFRTLALEKRSSEVWQVLGAVKTEFGKFGDVLAKVKAQTETVLKTLDSAEVRSRAMGRALKKVDALPDTQAQALLPTDRDFDRDADSGAG